MFERFTDPARRVVVLAQEEARMLGHGYIGTEHLLLGLVHEGEGTAAQVLEAAGVTLDRARVAVEELVDSGGHQRSGHIPFTPRAKTALELSLREAIQLKDKHIGTEHLLLGVLQEGGGVAIQVIERLGGEPPELRSKITALVTETRSPSSRARAAAAGNPAEGSRGSAVAALADENIRLRAEVEGLNAAVDSLQGEVRRLRETLRRHGVDPTGGVDPEGGSEAEGSSGG